MSVFSKTACDFRKGYGIQMMLFRQKRKYIIVLLLCTFCIAVFAGCSNSADDPLNNDTVDTTENTAESPAPENTPEPVVLTEQELAQWTDYVNSRENNAFLLSYYDEPSTIDLNELFYTGCGLDMENLSDKEVQEYLAWAGADEVYTEFTRLTGEQIASVLKLRLGLTLEDMAQPFEWCYLAESDAYVMQHGDTNTQNFTCIAGIQTGNQVVLDCLSQMTGSVCRVTLVLPENSEIWMFVSNKAVTGEITNTDDSDISNDNEAFEDSIFISDEAYNDVYYRLGAQNAEQLRVFAENYDRFLPEEGMLAGGSLGIAVCDLDRDGQLELMCTFVQGSLLFSWNVFFHADVENGQLIELDLTPSPGDLAFEIEHPLFSEEWANAYQDDQGRILYIAADYARLGMQLSFRTDGYYYLENEEVVSVPLRSYLLELNEEGEETCTYFLPGSDSPVTKEDWENAGKAFLNGKTALDVSICWKDVYETEISEKKVLGWFLLLAESLSGAVWSDYST